MDIQISDNYRITSDKRQFILQERNVIEEGERKGEWTQFKPIGYFGNLRHLVRKFNELQIYNSNATSIEELAKHVDEIHSQITDAIRKIEKEIK